MFYFIFGHLDFFFFYTWLITPENNQLWTFAARYSNVDNLKNLSFEVWRFRLMQRNENTMQHNHNVKHRHEAKSV